MVENLFNVRFKESGGYLVFLQVTVNMSHALLGVFLHNKMRLNMTINYFKMTSTHMCVAKHFLHDEVVVDRLCELFALVWTFGLLIISDLFIELQLRHWLVAIVFAIIFEQLKACFKKLIIKSLQSSFM